MRCLSGGKARNSLFPVQRILLYLIVGWMLGYERIFPFRRLHSDPLLQRHGWPGRRFRFSLVDNLDKADPELIAKLALKLEELKNKR